MLSVYIQHSYNKLSTRLTRTVLITIIYHSLFTLTLRCFSRIIESLITTTCYNLLLINVSLLFLSILPYMFVYTISRNEKIIHSDIVMARLK